MPQSKLNDPNLDKLPEWLHWLDSCPSTNTWATDHAAQLHHGDVVFTPHQTAGRGQQGRIWYAPPGVMNISLVLDPLPIAQLPGLSLAVGLAVIYAIEDLMPHCQGVLRLKWPNDVWIDQRKVSGILCEAAPSQHSSHTRVIVGIGLNRWADFAESGLDHQEMANIVSLHQVSSLVPDELSLLERLRHYLLQTAGLFSRTDLPAEDAGLALLLPELRRRDALLNRDIILELAGETLSGQAVGIDAQGRLQLHLSDGQVCAFTSGRVRWR